ncbi:MAG: TonB-dependent receptor [Kiritimatiellae bacterium]|nr:TonB-dependent receptor [Kiritimatiellia bacterium]
MIFRAAAIRAAAALASSAAILASAADSGEVADLGSVLVEGDALSKYRPETVASGTFTDVAPEKLPMVVDTLTSDFIREHNPTDLHDLLRYVPGIETGGKSLLVRNPGQFSIRGMGGTEPAFDGVSPIGRGPGLFMDAFLLDRVEIAKGPIASLAGGAGAAQNASGAGGSVNMYLKSADLGGTRREFADNVSAGKDTFRQRAMVDVNETSAGGDGAVRVVATADWYEPTYVNTGSAKGGDPRESYAIAPSAVWAPSEDFSFGVKSLFQYTEQPSYIGVPVWRGKPAGGYGWRESSCRETDRSSYKSFFVAPWAEFRATDEWTLRVGASAMVSEWDQTTREPYTPGMGTDELSGYFRTGTWASGEKYMMSGFSESSAVMHNYAAYVRAVHDKEFSDTLRNVFLFQPDYGYRSASGGFGTPTSRWGATLQDTVERGPVTLLGGLRYDWFDQESYETAGRGGAVRYPSMTAGALSPRAGLSVRPLDWLVFFGNASQTRTPMLGLRCADGTTPDHDWRATQGEGGVRVRPLDRLWFSVSAYRIDQEDVPEFDNDGIVLDYDGKNRSEGAEVSLSGDITDDWTVLAMYAHNRYTDRNVPRGRKGRTFERYPADTFSLNTSWRVPGGALEGVVLGAGLRVRSKSYATMRGAYVDENLRFDSSCVADVSASVPFSVAGGSPDWAVTLGIRNLFDEKYFESARHYYECLAGEPRTFEIGIRGTF